MISIRNLSYSYPQGRTPALLDIDWQIEDGEFVLVAGPSGSGKSTLLRCLNGLVPHFSGGTITGELNVYGVSPIEAGPRILSRVIGFVAQDPEAQSVLDQVEGEIAFALENAAISATEMRVRVEEVLDLLNLAPLRRRAVQTLSGGERQRLAIAAALALKPKVLLLDEPTSQLDPQAAEDVLQALVRLNEELGLTIILAEHRMERILRYADRLTWLEKGRIIADGAVRDVLTRIEAGPPLVQLARVLDWQPLPLTIKEGKQFVSTLPTPSPVADKLTPSPPVGPPLLEIEGLRFAYNGHQTLKNIDLTLHAGEAVALMGRNGAGKSTVLKCIAGVLAAHAGDIRVGGRSTRGRAVADICREVGYLPQNPDDLLFAETVIEEMQVTLRNHRLAELVSDIELFLNSLGLNELGHAYPRDLSVGQRQRVAMGAVTVTRPRLLLLDEPTRGLDPNLKASLVELWRRWLGEDAALLIVTHDVELAAMIASRTIMMSQGEIIASGPTKDILGGAPHFAPQIARLFPGRGWLTVADAVAGLKQSTREEN